MGQILRSAVQLHSPDARVIACRDLPDSPSEDPGIIILTHHLTTTFAVFFSSLFSLHVLVHFQALSKPEFATAR